MFLLEEPDKRRLSDTRHVAVGYVRQSFTRAGKDMESPERQRANIEAIAKYYGLTLELFEDADGHKSGFTEKNRLGWRRAEARLSDPDVAALIANDLARLHRKGWRIGKLIDFLEERDLHLILAAPGRQVDLSTPFGRILCMFIAMCDEWYVLDASQRQIDSVEHRRKLGQTIGMPCFGTIRKQGYLVPTRQGAWFLTNSQHVPGEAGDTPPAEGALWRGYFDCVERLMQLYVENTGGLDLVAARLNEEGWAFRDRHGLPRPFTRDDARRVVANWAKYAGLNPSGKAKNQRRYSVEEVDAILKTAERSLLPLDLLRAVALTRIRRSITTRTTGAPRTVYPYALAGLLRCAHCERRAQEQNNVRVRARIGGAAKKGVLRYRHAESARCTATTRSVTLEDVELELEALIARCSLRRDALSVALDLAGQAEFSPQPAASADSEAQRRRAIQRCHLRLKNAGYRLDNGDIDQTEYERRVAQYKEELARLEATAAEPAAAALSLLECIRAMSDFLGLWEMASPENRQAVARLLFDEVIYDLDAKRITDYKLKLWAQYFLEVAPAS